MANTIDLIGDNALTDSIIEKTITEITDNEVETVGMYAFYDCKELVSAVFDSATYIGEQSFYGCEKLELADFPVCKTINRYAFYGCSALRSLVIRKTDGICSMTYKDALTDSAIDNADGYIYVPSALVETYKTTSSWSTYADQIRAIEDFSVDGTVTGKISTAILGECKLGTMKLG